MRYPVLLMALVAIGSAVAVRAGAAAPGAEPDAPALSRKDVLTWPRARADRFGCFLEKAFGHKDSRFDCELRNYANRGDPCRDVEAWGEGPQFPADKVSLVHPLVAEIQLSWEHGELQAVIVTFREKLERPDVWKELGIPDPTVVTRPNVMSFDVRQHGGRTTLIVQGFDHMGAGDAECAE